MTAEIWKPLPEFEGRYEISNMGRVKSLPRRRRDGRWLPGCIRKQNPSSGGYSTLKLYYGDGTYKGVTVHKVVAEVFLGARANGMQVNHKNGDKMDNRVTNLEYVTPSQNLRHAYDNLGIIGPRGEIQGSSKLTEPQVKKVVGILQNSSRTQKEIAKIFNVTRGAIKGINIGFSWRWLTEPLCGGCYPIRVTRRAPRKDPTDQEVIEWGRLYATGQYSLDEIAERYGVTGGTVQRALVGETKQGARLRKIALPTEEIDRVRASRYFGANQP